MKKLSILALIIMVGAGILITSCDGCRRRPDAAVGAARTHLQIVQPMMPTQLDPALANEVPMARANYLIYQTLVYQWEGDIIPGLATSWEFVDSRTVIFTIREGVRFHDGSILTPEDVVFSINRASVAPPVGIITNMISEAVAIGGNRVRVTTELPFAPILNHLAHTATSIVSRDVVTRLGDAAHSQNPVGTGPFRFHSMVAGDRFELVRFDDFNSVVPGLPPGQLPAVERLTFRIVPEASVRTIELETAAADVLVDAGAADVARMRAHRDINMVEVPNWALNTWLGFNTQRPPFNDVRVRQAISLALDIPTIVDVAWAGLGIVGRGPLPTTIAGFVEFPPINQNVARARELMAQAGLSGGFSTDLWVNAGNAMRADAAVMIQAQLRALNIETAIRIYEWGVLLPGTAAGEHGMSLMGWTTVTGDIDYGLYPLYHSANWGDPGNRQFYSNPRVDRLLELGRSETNAVRRMEYYREAQELIMTDLPLIPLWQAAELHAARTNIGGFVVTPCGRLPFWLVYFR